MGEKKLSFEWDPANTIKNWSKHNIRPFEAEEAFKDNFALVATDPKHMETEHRWILIGKTKKHRILYIAFTIRSKRIRVISMRIANKKEVNEYEKTTNTA